MTIRWDRVGPGIRDRRTAAGLTQAALAKVVGVEWQTIARVETGARKPSFELLERLAETFGCQVCDLIPETPVRRRRRSLQ
jgi:putative transcriptional regulator